ncbi:MAG: tetratricopeptide repeat protein [Nitrospirae bacterium]|nr:MAG: tetratricopeptide repeat protein [Nitrospirota bacterium]
MSILFVSICLLLVTGVIIALSWPFWRKYEPSSLVPQEDAAADQERADLLVERDVLTHSLQELEMELAQGRLDHKDYLRLKATDERRLLAVLQRLDVLAQTETPPKDESAFPRPRGTRWAISIIMGLAIVVTSGGIYGYIQWRTVERLVAAHAQMSEARGRVNPLEMVARLEARLQENPDDLQGQILAGRSYMALQQYEKAKKAWEKVLELDPRNHEAHFQLGVLLLETRTFDDPHIFQAALAHFDRVLADLPNQPAANWYRGFVLWHLKRYRETEEAWATAFKNLEPGSQDAEFVKTALMKLRAGQSPFEE